MVQRTFYALPSEAPPEEPEWEPPPDDVHTLRHGYNLADLDALARASTHRIWGISLDFLTRFEVARSAIAEHLYAAEERPDPGDLVYAGAAAVARHAQDEQRHHGIGRGYNAGFSPKFTVYWDWAATVQHGFETSVIERVTFWQIWEQLGDQHRKVFAALAAHGTYQAAADACGTTYETFCHSISRARSRFLLLWHEGEEPSRPWGHDRRVRDGGGRAELDVTARARRATRRPRTTPKPVVHGLTRYQRHGCRCETCRAANVRHLERRRAAYVPVPAKPPRTHCRHGHDLAEVGVTNAEECRQCSRDKAARYRQRKQGVEVDAA